MRDREKKNRRRWWLLLLPLFIVVMVLGWRLLPRLEGTAPLVKLEGFQPYVGESACFSIVVSDKTSGLRRIWAGLLTGGQEVVLIENRFSADNRVPAEEESRFRVCIEPAARGIVDGEATLRIMARDCSWRNWLKGNLTYLEKTVTIDTQKPELEVLSRRHYVNQGGSGLVVYRVYEKNLESGVQVGDHFFPGYSGGFPDPDIFLAFFALAYDQGKETPMFVMARDKAGNTAKRGFSHLNKPQQFASERMVISDSFLSMKMPEFEIPGDHQRLVEKFVAVNSKLRKRDNDKIRSLCQGSDAVRHWQGKFIRFPNSARKAGFADHRSYVYQGETIGRAVHMGIDLASVAGAPVPAANRGRVAFAGRIGIYGRTVIIDHGMGLFSLYGHLSNLSVSAGQMVGAGEIIGNSGMTGLAGGDHLHFGMLVQTVFVNPVEWWDPSWIENNIMSKIKAVTASG